jgi:hypothetical protein
VTAVRVPLDVGIFMCEPAAMLLDLLPIHVVPEYELEGDTTPGSSQQKSESEADDQEQKSKAPSQSFLVKMAATAAKKKME